ncbi:HET-domain-containing protein [Mollisia scopiformis]|uniref:HET-domain-containing protein n=1 Tax=Mollisia scopiformis TaxID=149040 RepID=A0A194XBZ5_MOLSC|nr:HET-domain-containing protein [Mollisia scopiformis]KUJ17277.1 HET-domain-containing protein [Mollisia scopiformis]
MRLLNARTRKLREFMGDDTPPYAILSHTWGRDEVTFQDLNLAGSGQDKLGYEKIRKCCEQAIQDGLYWAWVDTCCIDKTSSAELSEAINSMFRWYQKAQVCYVYLSDVSGCNPPQEEELAQSRWFTRSWTLQELIAPRFVLFYSRIWEHIGTKEQLADIISSITTIDEEDLCGTSLELVSVAKKMSWAAKRKATRLEDTAYSLLGLFDVNMPLLYGEGQKAFIRLQEEILKSSYDHSLFAWRLDEASIIELKRYTKLLSRPEFLSSQESTFGGLLADSPAAFQKCHKIVSMGSWGHVYHSPPVIHNKCVYIDLPVIRRSELDESFAVLDCRLQDDDQNYLAVPLRQWGIGTFSGRLRDLVLVPSDCLNFDSKTLSPENTERLRIKAPTLNEGLQGCFFLAGLPPEASGYQLRSLHCKAGARFDRKKRILRPEKHARGAQAVFVFGNKHGDRFALVLAQYSRSHTSCNSVAYVKILNNGHIEDDIELRGYMHEVDVAGGSWLSTYLGKVSITPIGTTNLQIQLMSQSSRHGPTESVIITEYIRESYMAAGRG